LSGRLRTLLELAVNSGQRREVAPSAMRTPISLVGWVTAYESTPYNPSDASNSASSANPLKSAVFCDGADNCRPTISSTVCTRVTGSFLSTDQMACRTAATIDAGSTTVRTTMPPTPCD
jgi:hypothetical protein